MEIDMDDALPEAEAGMVSDAGQEEKSELSGMIVDGSDGDAGNWNSELLFVKWVLWQALGEGVNDHKLGFAAAVHAVILESGFVCLDSVPCAPSSGLTMSLSYTLPEILTDGSVSTNNVVLKFQSLGPFVVVYASLSDAGSAIRRLCFDECKFAPALELMQLMLVKCDMNATMKNGDDRVFELWKMVKDGLALPLTIDLREKAGLSAPPCFMSVPKELQRRIIECLPGVDVAKVGSVCSELRHLCSDNDLWKLKFEEEFGQRNSGESSGGRSFCYKHLFAKKYSRKKRLERRASGYVSRRRQSNPNGGPSIPAVGRDSCCLRGLDLNPRSGQRQPNGGTSIPAVGRNSGCLGGLDFILFLDRDNRF